MDDSREQSTHMGYGVPSRGAVAIAGLAIYPHGLRGALGVSTM